MNILQEALARDMVSRTKARGLKPQAIDATYEYLNQIGFREI
ncbi:MAG: hypothetical protein ACXW2O_08520 [Candidatus Aminicenantales bacterium]